MSSIVFITMASVSIGGFLAWLLYLKILMNWYGAERKYSRRANIKYWMGVIAIIYIGMGVAEIVGELMLTQIMNFKWNNEKIFSGLTKIILIPACICVLSFAVVLVTKEKIKDDTLNDGVGKDSTNNKATYLNYLIFAILSFVILFQGYIQGKEISSKGVLDFYLRIDTSNCQSPFEKSPFVSVYFKFKKETNEIFRIEEWNEPSSFKQNKIIKMSPCSVIDEKNWSCGGDIYGDPIKIAPAYTMVDGKVSYIEGSTEHLCAGKVIPRLN